MGDGVMALFGLADHDDGTKSANSAIYAALDLKELLSIRELNGTINGKEMFPKY
jgi:hypothetical protein